MNNLVNRRQRLSDLEMPDLSRSVNDFFQSMFAPVGEPRADQWTPRVEVIEDGDAYLVSAEVPGLTHEDVRLSLEKDTLTIEGERKAPQFPESATWRVYERSYATFRRSFTFPVPVAAEDIQAEVEAGLLRVRVPKARDAKRQVIQVRGK